MNKGKIPKKGSNQDEKEVVIKIGLNLDQIRNLSFLKGTRKR